MKTLASPFIWQISIPIPNYYHDEIYHQQVYIATAKRVSPSLEKVLDVCKTRHITDSQYHEYCGVWAKCIEALNNCKDFPVLYDTCVSSSTHIPTAWLNQPLSVTLVTIVDETESA